MLQVYRFNVKSINLQSYSRRGIVYEAPKPLANSSLSVQFNVLSGHSYIDIKYNIILRARKNDYFSSYNVMSAINDFTSYLVTYVRPIRVDCVWTIWSVYCVMRRPAYNDQQGKYVTHRCFDRKHCYLMTKRQTDSLYVCYKIWTRGYVFRDINFCYYFSFLCNLIFFLSTLKNKV